MRQSLLFMAVLWSTAGIASAQVSPGTVLCESYKDAKNYQLYIKSNPSFAEDLIDRAACFEFQGNEQPIVKETGEDYIQYKLLSGHLVWGMR